ncbi:MAG: hypothetical protein JNJ42_06685 [Burkholderiaceae bacterium]|nr:hypothetical protein [Burkholderiaceae bacterium]
MPRRFAFRPVAPRAQAAVLAGTGAAVYAACPPGQVPGALGGCVKPPTSPYTMCSYQAATKYPPTSPGAGTDAFKQKVQQYIEQCMKTYEQQGSAGGARRMSPPSATGLRAVAPDSTASPGRDGTATKAMPAARATADAGRVPKALPDVTLACGLAAKGMKAVGSGSFATMKREYEFTATHTGSAPLPAALRIVWSVQPHTAAPTPPGGVHTLQAPLAPKASLMLGTVLGAPAIALQQCTAGAKP